LKVERCAVNAGVLYRLGTMWDHTSCALTDASLSSRESLSEVVWLFAVCVSPKMEPMTLPL
jgi:hypothetical protein